VADQEIKIFVDPLSALCYLTECTLATVESLELRTRPPTGELRRQKAIAETGLRNLHAHRFAIETADKMHCTRVGDWMRSRS